MESSQTDLALSHASSVAGRPVRRPLHGHRPRDPQTRHRARHGRVGRRRRVRARCGHHPADGLGLPAEGDPHPGHHCRSEEHTSELQSHVNLVCRLLLEKKKNMSTCSMEIRSNGAIIRSVCKYLRKPASQIPYHGLIGVTATSEPASSIISFFFNDTATTEIYTLSLHDALPICRERAGCPECSYRRRAGYRTRPAHRRRSEEHTSELQSHVKLVCRLLLENK